MCARFSLTSPVEALRRLFNFTASPNLAPAYNITPTSKIAAIRKQSQTHEDTAENELFFPSWGLIPGWAKDPAISTKLINARSETVSEKPSFRSAFKHRRCLIPATGFYEWQKSSDGGRQPYFIQSTDHEICAFAGLWEEWSSPAGNDNRLTCTILTCEAPTSITGIHHRAPLTILPEQFDLWLEGSDKFSIPDEQHREQFKAYPVSKKVGNVREKGPELMDEISLSPSPTQGQLF